MAETEKSVEGTAAVDAADGVGEVDVSVDRTAIMLARIDGMQSVIMHPTTHRGPSVCQRPQISRPLRVSPCARRRAAGVISGMGPARRWEVLAN